MEFSVLDLWSGLLLLLESWAKFQAESLPVVSLVLWCLILWCYLFAMAIGVNPKGFGLPAKTSNTKVILNGGQQVTFARPDGYFALYPTRCESTSFIFILKFWWRITYYTVLPYLSKLINFVLRKNIQHDSSVLSKENVALIKCTPLVSCLLLCKSFIVDILSAVFV